MAGKRELEKVRRESRNVLLLAAPRAAQVLRELLEDAEAPPKLRFDVAMRILEQLGPAGPGSIRCELAGELQEYAQ